MEKSRIGKDPSFYRQNLVGLHKVTLIKSNLKSLKCGSISAKLVNGKSLLIIDYTFQNNIYLAFIQETWIKEGANKYETSLAWIVMVTSFKTSKEIQEEGD